MQQCLFCGHTVTLVHVHGHYQCAVCNTNAFPCCDGDNCDTNYLLFAIPLNQSVVSSSSVKTNTNNNEN